ncbi:hypothetical protein [Rhodopirellula sp. MGV]|uniref:hypothetical protein n=1 Tax=Rhodopirellula sp. MGV TaxID=2023130 RepID=UPI000B977D66|nr:hypothetical protein [Rhodopirellula sp. MGV]OYP34039.1 hypothetical protein CGZ80_16640 [Rhodopirellula sp. MGV]PNY38333.1 hypothetical protein C2E31_03210 [Rhodopirellula baltica]
MFDAIFWKGRLTEDSIKVDRVWGDSQAQRLFRDPGFKDPRVKHRHPLERIGSPDSEVIKTRLSWLANADSTGILNQSYELATEPNRTTIDESLSVFADPSENGTAIGLLGHFAATAQSLPITDLRRSLHKINNELSVASMGIQVLSLLIEKSRLAEEEKSLNACQSSIAAIERVAMLVTTTLKSLPRG